MKTTKNTKAKKIDQAAMNEPIIEWIFRDCPEEDRAAEDFPGGITFAEAYESLKAGWGLGAAENCETALREKVWKRLAEIVEEPESRRGVLVVVVALSRRVRPLLQLSHVPLLEETGEMRL